MEPYSKTERTGIRLRGLGNVNAPGWNYAIGPFLQEVKVTDHLDGFKNPSWRSQVRAVKSATTVAFGQKYKFQVVREPFHTWKIERSYHGISDGTISRSFHGWAEHPAGAGFWRPDVVTTPPSVRTHAYNQAVEKLYKQLNSFASATKAGETVGELGQTLRALKNPLASVRNLLLDRHYKNLSDLARWKSPVRLADALADTHLEFAFGWKPLASSIGEAIVALQNRERFAFYHPFYAKGEAQFDGSTYISHGGFAERSLTTWSKVGKSNHVVVISGVWGEERNVDTVSVNRALGLQPRDILPTIWNLIPYSFLADYFVNIGNIVDSLGVPWGGVKWAQMTEVTENSISIIENHSAAPHSVPPFKEVVKNDYSKPGVYNASVKTFSRGSIGGLPLPDLEFTRIGDITGRQWLNMAALAVSQSAKLLLGLTQAVKKEPALPELFIESLKRKGGYRDPYPFHRGK